MGRIDRVAHTAFGLITSLVAFVSPVHGFANAILFTMYVLDKACLNYKAYKEAILDFCLGLAIGEVVTLCLRFLQHL
jgi:hypothetical protein